MAGPSRQVAFRPVFLPTPQMSRRTFSLGSYLPEWMTKRQEKAREAKMEERAEKPAPTPTKREKKASETSDGSDEGVLGSSIFEGVEETIVEEEKVGRHKDRGPFVEHKYTTARHKMSPQKLKLLATQISKLPVDEAILQMQFSDKAAATWIKSNLALARDHAIWYKGATREKLIVSEAIVNKDKYGPKQIDIRARGKHGIKRHPFSRLVIILRHGKTKEEKDALYFKREANRRVRSATWVREDRKLPRKFNSSLAW